MDLIGRLSNRRVRQTIDELSFLIKATR